MPREPAGMFVRLRGLEVSSVQHVAGQFCHRLREERRKDREQRREGKEGSRDRWRTSGEGRVIKREGVEERIWKYGWKVQRWREGIKSPPRGGGGPEKELPVGSGPPRPKKKKIGSSPLNMPPMCLLHLSFCHWHFLTKLFHLSAVPQMTGRHTKSSADSWMIPFISWKKSKSAENCSFLISRLFLIFISKNVHI